MGEWRRPRAQHGALNLIAHCLCSRPPLIIRWKDILDLRDENAVSDDSTSTTARAQVPRAKVALGTAVLTPEMISLMSRDRVCHASLKRAGLVPVA